MYNDMPYPHQIAMHFTREEWESIVQSLELTIHDRCIGNEGEMERNIIDRIEKTIGVE